MDCAVSSVKLPNGTELTASQFVRLKCSFEGKPRHEIIKFYVLPIMNTIILGGDWLRGNNILIDYSNNTLVHRSGKAFLIPFTSTLKNVYGAPPSLS